MSNRQKLELEYSFRCSKSFLYKYISNPGGLAEWYADDVQYRNNQYCFVWDEEDHVATLSESKINQVARFKWVNEDHAGEFLEFRLLEEDLTRETILKITDFCEENDRKEAEMLWDISIQRLREIIGA